MGLGVQCAGMGGDGGILAVSLRTPPELPLAPMNYSNPLTETADAGLLKEVWLLFTSAREHEGGLSPLREGRLELGWRRGPQAGCFSLFWSLYFSVFSISGRSDAQWMILPSVVAVMSLIRTLER